MAKEPDEEQSTGHENVRRVYALPAEMVERITQFQREKGLSSEVEAARRLLDEALKSRDNIDSIINRLLAKLGQIKIASEAARDVLIGHPLVAALSFGDESVTFTLKSNDKATVFESGYVIIGDKGNEWVQKDKNNPYAGGHREIPF
ncbi:hypothetical protein [Paracoccus alkanivorans]|uniref:Uncharacterized protein n=1 Tax=Paracoccus alkanivorans TaxID=2116655 RepID=A0A3M0MCL7_9RHOB|nr:hypothetical protein [Paracoccus alkanivorans]RMC35351.1 hypothetical protein C9E81_08905 [Paracoccus alkanivorans]